MSEATSSKSSACGDDVGADLAASLLITRKHANRWRISYYIILISLRKSKTASESPPSPSSAPYTPLPPSEPPALARTSSSRSFVAIDIDSDADEKKQRIWSDIDRIVKDQDLESLNGLGGVDDVYSVLSQQRPEVSINGIDPLH